MKTAIIVINTNRDDREARQITETSIQNMNVLFAGGYVLVDTQSSMGVFIYIFAKEETVKDEITA